LSKSKRGWRCAVITCVYILQFFTSTSNIKYVLFSEYELQLSVANSSEELQQGKFTCDTFLISLKYEWNWCQTKIQMIKFNLLLLIFSSVRGYENVTVYRCNIRNNDVSARVVQLVAAGRDMANTL